MTSVRASEYEESGKGFERITSEMKERLKLLLSQTEKAAPSEDLAATPSELDEMCRLAVSKPEITQWHDDLDHMAKEDPYRMSALLSVLATRDYDRLIPIKEESFSYRRYLQECQKLKKSANALLNMKGKGLADETKYDRWLEDVARLMVLQTRVGRWLEENYFPGLYEGATNTARGEVMQYLIKQKNTRNLNVFRECDRVRIHFLDEVQYLANDYGKNPYDSIGCIQDDEIFMRIPGYYSDLEEWEIFCTLVHELVHYASFHTLQGVGLKAHGDTRRFNMLNECVTDLVTWAIVNSHIEKQKTHLKGQRHKDLIQMGYADYIVIVKQILSRIPMEYFVDAMLNADGMVKLRAKFEDVFGESEALDRYAENLTNSYLTIQERIMLKKQKAPVIDLDSRRLRPLEDI